MTTPTIGKVVFGPSIEPLKEMCKSYCGDIGDVYAIREAIAAYGALKAENDHLKEGMKCFKCDNCGTPLYCLKCASEPYKRALDSCRELLEESRTFTGKTDDAENLKRLNWTIRRCEVLTSINSLNL